MRKQFIFSLALSAVLFAPVSAMESSNDNDEHGNPDEYCKQSQELIRGNRIDRLLNDQNPITMNMLPEFKTKGVKPNDIIDQVVISYLKFTNVKRYDYLFILLFQKTKTHRTAFKLLKNETTKKNISPVLLLNLFFWNLDRAIQDNKDFNIYKERVEFFLKQYKYSGKKELLLEWIIENHSNAKNATNILKKILTHEPSSYLKQKRNDLIAQVRKSLFNVRFF
jgi:hypothetical protein